MAQFDFSARMNETRLEEFSYVIESMSRSIGFKVSSRGWCYLLEQARYINKDQFDKVENAINKCRKLGFLPVDFVAEEDARAFAGVETPDSYSMKALLKWRLQSVLKGTSIYTPDWWEDETYYIQVVVEKIDLKTLFEPVCEEYHIPIANAKGWQSILQRAEYSRRFREAEERGLECILLYCGDHDPDGLRISDTLRKNLEQVADVTWDDGEAGYDPTNLRIERFGLNYQFIIENDYTWIDNLITGSGGNLASPLHKNHSMPYVQTYLREIGERKCEANAIVTTPDTGRLLMREAIEQYLGDDAKGRFAEKRAEIERKYQDEIDNYDLLDRIQGAIDDIDEDPDFDDD